LRLPKVTATGCVGCCKVSAKKPRDLKNHSAAVVPPGGGGEEAAQVNKRMTSVDGRAVALVQQRSKGAADPPKLRRVTALMMAAASGSCYTPPTLSRRRPFSSVASLYGRSGETVTVLVEAGARVDAVRFTSSCAPHRGPSCAH
jgi:hypothetical protein